ncbi:lipoprotein [Streptomyces fulvorobeus]|uniref:Lipoprotein n=1 Tax=Streptomyces fulvorobeus TaxID=284028 RepID=A0A7J0C7Y7_9ACTN|nr:lipoprotein [Streptomyces fulvorobeus]
MQQHRCGGGALAFCALTVAGVMAVTAGCSGGSGAGDASGRGERLRAEAAGAGGSAETLRRAADVLAAAGSAEMRTSMETSAGGTRVTIRGRGAYDFRRQLGRVTVVLPKDAAGEEGHRPITELLAPGALYMKNRGAGVPDEKWVRVDTTALEDGNLVTGGVTDPMAAAELLRSARDVTYVGETELAGVTVHHYRGTAHLGRAAGGASARSRGALAAAAKGFSADAVPFDAYLDEDGRLRKVRHRFSFASDGPAVEVVSTMLLYGFGVPVAVRLPAGGDIYTGLIQQGRTGEGGR